MPASHGQVSARKRSGAIVVTSVTMRPMNHGTALSVSATKNSTTNSATNSHFAWRAKCQKKRDQPGRRLRMLGWRGGGENSLEE